MTMISDLPEELVVEILSRVPLTSLSAVRSTLKRWNALSKDRLVCKGEARQQFLGFMMMDMRVCSVRFDLLNDPSIKQIGKLDQFEISDVFHCNGLVLCVINDYSRIVVWNPYLGQTKLIESGTSHCRSCYSLGCDSCGSHKILRFFNDSVQGSGRRVLKYKIYHVNSSSSSWRVLDVTPDWYISFDHRRGVSIKGNTYWIAIHSRRIEEEEIVLYDFLLCFDFTKERFGPRLQLPFNNCFDITSSLCCVREEQLALMFQHSGWYKMEIWVTTKIEPQVVSWSKFFAFDMTPYAGLNCAITHGSFFIDMEKKVAVLFDLTIFRNSTSPRRNIAYIIGEDGYYMEVDLAKSECDHCRPVVCSYVPSLVQIE
ncbi:F-box-like domain superfamily [Arabidopsis suecica]|uniref:F-box-like domain superfamily n=1 Tax=Arabidopsis suecica TaxID=45249 RepID=A0A8T1YGD5_ARASU|nr:F-box-like domain superfamily [Arabidopsis suecica]